MLTEPLTCAAFDSAVLQPHASHPLLLAALDWTALCLTQSTQVLHGKCKHFQSILGKQYTFVEQCSVFGTLVSWLHACTFNASQVFDPSARSSSTRTAVIAVQAVVYEASVFEGGQNLCCRRVYTFDATSSTPGGHTAVATLTKPDSNSANNQDSAPITVLAVRDVAVNITASPNTGLVGSSLTYKVNM